MAALRCLCFLSNLNLSNLFEYFFPFLEKINFLEAWICDCISISVSSGFCALVSHTCLRVQAFTFQNRGFLCLIIKLVVNASFSQEHMIVVGRE